MTDWEEADRLLDLVILVVVIILAVVFVVVIEACDWTGTRR